MCQESFLLTHLFTWLVAGYPLALSLYLFNFADWYVQTIRSILQKDNAGTLSLILLI